MKYAIRATTQYRRSLKKISRSNPSLVKKLETVIDTIASGEKLSANLKDHALTGRLGVFRECHIAPDWLLIYHVDHNVLVLTLVNTGSHSDLFG